VEAALRAGTTAGLDTSVVTDDELGATVVRGVLLG
jgi:hypothetical protein